MSSAAIFAWRSKDKSVSPIFHSDAGRGDGDFYRRDIATSPQHAQALSQAQHVAMPHITPGLTGRHVLTVSSFNKDQLHQLFNLAHHIRASVQRDRPLDYILKVS